MAIATVEIKCEKCGKTFTVRRECYNRRDAENYEKWAIDNISTCPACRRLYSDEERTKLVEEYNLPAISGVSEKQIAYADSLRTKFLIAKREWVETYHSWLADVDWSIAETMAKEQGKTTHEIVDAAFSEMMPEYHAIKVALQSSSAREIIDALK